MAESSALQICPLIQRILPLRNQESSDYASQSTFQILLCRHHRKQKTRVNVAFNQRFLRFLFLIQSFQLFLLVLHGIKFCFASKLTPAGFINLQLVGYKPGNLPVISLFHAFGQWGRGERKRHSKSSPLFPPVLSSCLRFLNSADPTISERATG